MAPVIDHGVDEMVKQADGEKHGCWGRTRMSSLVNLGPPHGLIPNRMSRTCRYDQSLTDPGCAGCPSQGLGEAYAAGVIANGK